MTGRRWRGWLPWLACASSWLAPAALAQSVGTQAVAEPALWLARMHTAAATANYQGTMVFSAGGNMSSSRVWHYCVADQTYERLEALDGRQQNIVRHNDNVQTIWPQTRVAVLEKRDRKSVV